MFQTLIARLLDDRPQREALLQAIAGEAILQVTTVRKLAEAEGEAVDLLDEEVEVTPKFIEENAAVIALFMAESLHQAKAANLPAFNDGRLAQISHIVEEERTRFDAAATFLVATDRVTETVHRCLTRRRLAAVALAVKLYRADHAGTLPQRLEDLVPVYLPAVPMDPLAAGRPLGYAPGDPTAAEAWQRRPRVWSVGSDAIDHTGRIRDVVP